MFTAFQRFLTPYLNDKPIYVAYSGGMDSQVLLHLLVTLRNQIPSLNIGAVHIHHGLSSNADSWQVHCANICEQWQVSFLTARLSLRPDAGESLEAAARKARYAAIAKLVPANSVVLLGHHLQDQLETMLLQLKRGAGPKGLSAMGKETLRDGHLYLRPLLEIERDDILAYAKANKLQWIEDESNADERFDRNFLRHNILPMLQSRWPAMAKATARSARLCAEQQSLLDEVVSGYLQKLRRAPTILDIPLLMAHARAWQQQIIRLWLAGLDAPALSEKQLDMLKDEVLLAREDANPCLSFGGYELRRFDNALYLLKQDGVMNDFSVLWHGQHELALPDGRIVLFSRSSDNQHPDTLCLSVPDGAMVSLQTGGFSQRFRPVGAPHSKPLKQWFKQWRMPPWERERLIMVRVDDTIAGILGFGADQAFSPVNPGDGLLCLCLKRQETASD
ncbi:tRNA lysidine(34) synthetase TilS [Aliiglaciecola sp. CAU 1673]|uniref:tRNA lysidine(34) synthetase TilS n=1 Tax=Aliiglaciecola sp. CAU 1673 TaxID=3032595 RepID=UPI0023DBB99F|nr:tRNA lysidine(34) synthetase TilS [Aliiglaciecola sp. CAU 1673]MDF2179608.1 tRNA lysidine(34) synthetase TilS [Aliiglaciecola sp. CAU 1673]